MGNNTSVVIQGVGTYVPQKRLTNQDLTKIVETTDEWIQTRTGISERRIAAEDESTIDLAEHAARAAIQDAGISPDEIDLVIVATITPTMPFPATACLLQARLGLRQIMAFDLEAACSGFTYALETAESLLKSGRHSNALIVGAEKISSILDWTDRTTCVLFGDGAGAAILSCKEAGDYGIIDSISRSDGADPSLLQQPAGGSAIPASTASIESGSHFLKMRGRDLFKVVVRVVNTLCREILERNGLEAHQIKLIVPHQANVRMIESMAKHLEISADKFFVNLDRFGNTSAASVPIALREALDKGLIQTGDYVLLVAFGAGLTWSASLIKWH
ncbi:MAG: beta-ketoacyl-ACP synthase III [Verrucomicrobiota bacterium]